MEQPQFLREENSTKNCKAKDVIATVTVCSQFRYYRKGQATMKKHVLLTLLTVGGAFGLLSVMGSLPVHQAHAQGNTSMYFVPTSVLQAAGPTAASIQSSVDAYGYVLDAPDGRDNKNSAGPLTSGHREINWDGKDLVAVNPFDGFLVTRGALFTTPDGTGFVQATPTGLAAQFNNPTYGTIFTAFS